jgi:signal peptidase I
MSPTFPAGQKVAIDEGAYSSAQPRRNDIVLVHPARGYEDNQCGRPLSPGQACGLPTPQQSGQRLVKRVVALPGDRLAIASGRVVLNRQLQSEPFIQPCQASDNLCSFPKPVTVPAGMYYVLGDNRGASDDSRVWGPVRKSWIVGKVTGKD